MTTALVIAGVLVAVAILVLGLHQILLWAERRGWIYYRNERGRGAVNLGFLDQIYQPSMEHVIEEETLEQTVADQSESGGEPDPGLHD